MAMTTKHLLEKYIVLIRAGKIGEAKAFAEKHKNNERFVGLVNIFEEFIGGFKELLDQVKNESRRL